MKVTHLGTGLWAWLSIFPLAAQAAGIFDIRLASEFSRIVDTNETLTVLGSGYGWNWKTLFIVAQPKAYSLPLKVAGTPAMKNLRISTAPGRLNLSWPAPSTGFQLESTAALDRGGVWVAVPDSPAVSDGLNFDLACLLLRSRTAVLPVAVHAPGSH
jgi:hypothetical protein